MKSSFIAELLQNTKKRRLRANNQTTESLLGKHNMRMDTAMRENATIYTHKTTSEQATGGRTVETNRR